jgi:hypothetical protein
MGATMEENLFPEPEKREKVFRESSSSIPWSSGRSWW